MTLLTANHLQKHYGSRPILEDISFTLEDNEHVGVVGVNGSGKSTLLRVLAGVEEADGGTLAIRRAISIGYLAQEPALNPLRTIRGEMEAAMVAHQAAIEAYKEVTARLAAPCEQAESDTLVTRLEALQHQIDFLGGYDLSHRIKSTLTPLGIDDVERLVGDLSGGEKKRVAIAQVLLRRPDILVLDEPTNHIDADTVLWLEAQLATYPGGIVLVTHDRYFLDKVVQRIVEIDGGRLTAYPGRYGDYLEAKARQAEIAEHTESTRRNLLRRELEWLRTGPKARTTKSQSRVDRAEALVAEKAYRPKEAASLDFGTSLRLGKTILRLEQVTKSFGDRCLIRELGMDLSKGDRIGIIGPNGAGKTTLLKMILGELRPDAGCIRQGANTQALYFDQTREQLNPDNTIREEVADQGDFVIVAGKKRHIVGYLEDFLFSPAVQRMPIRALSGGERNRVLLAKLMKRSCNLLILDEPTNDLDLMTLQVLEAAITRFEGCVLVVTHDRFFLNKVATSILAFEGEGRVIRYEGDYDLYRRLKARGASATGQSETSAEVPRGGRGGFSGAGEAGRAHSSAKATQKGDDKTGARRRRRKLSWNEERELEKLPEQIETLEAERTSVETQLGAPETYLDGARVKALTARLPALGEELEQLYARWEALETLKAELEAGER